MQRTKALGLLHKTVRENASMVAVRASPTTSSRCAPGECVGDDRVRHNAEVYRSRCGSKWRPRCGWTSTRTTRCNTRSARGVRRRAAHLPVAVGGHPPRHRAPGPTRRDSAVSPIHGHRLQKGHVSLGGATGTGARLDQFVGFELKRSLLRTSSAQPRCRQRRKQARAVRHPDRSGCVAFRPRALHPARHAGCADSTGPCSVRIEVSRAASTRRVPAYHAGRGRGFR